MKAKFIANWGLELEAETYEERYFLDCLDCEGVRVSSRTGSNMGPIQCRVAKIIICSPKLADLKQLLLDREQQALLVYALGFLRMKGALLETLGVGVEPSYVRLLIDLLTATKSVPPLPPRAKVTENRDKNEKEVA